MLASKVSKILKEKCSFHLELPVIVGVSGGPDSLSLLHILKEIDANVIVAHLDHQLRKESSDEASFIQSLSHEWGLPCILEKIDVANFAKERKLSIEEAARECRYHFLFKHAQIKGAQAVIVGHTADDQVETFLMHLLRGAGIDGLGGMNFCNTYPQWSEIIPLWRPLLGITRNEIEEYCKNNNLHPVFDKSNFDTTYFRNRLRHELIPVLETYNPQIKTVILRSTDVLRGDAKILRKVTEEQFNNCITLLDAHYVIFNREQFMQNDFGMKRRIVREAIDKLRPNLRDIGLDAVDKVIRATDNFDLNRRIDLFAHLDLVFAGDAFVIVEEGFSLPVINYPQLKVSEEKLFAGKPLRLQYGWVLSAELVPRQEYVAAENSCRIDINQAWLRGDGVSFPLMVRGRKAGDTWQPLGMQGHHQKISDLMINEKIPIEARTNYPLVMLDNEIIWIPGIRPCESYRLDKNETTILHLKIEKEPHS